MTVSATAPYIAYAGAGTSGPFAIPFRFLANADLVVSKADAAGVETTLTGNTITGADDDDGGELYTAAPVVAGETLKIYRATVRSQTAQYVANGPFPAATHERALDKAMLVDQEQDRELARSLKAPVGEVLGALPSADERASLYLAFDGSGQPIAAAGPVTGTPVSSFMQTVLDDVSDEATRDTLNAAANQSVMPFIPLGLRAAIKAKTSTTDVASYLRLAFAAGYTYLPEGLYNCGSAISVTGADGRVFRGDGEGLTELRFTGGTSGLSLTYSSKNSPVSIREMSITTTAFATGQALTITSPQVPTAYPLGCRVENLTIRGMDVTTDCWLNGIRFVDCWFPQITGITVKGLDDLTTPFDMAEGMRFVRCQAVHIDGYSAEHMNRGIYENETTFDEGFSIRDFEIVGVTIGIDIGGSAAAQIAGTIIGPGHINAYEQCIKLRNRLQLTLGGGLLLYKPGQSTAAWAGIDVTSCGNLTLDDLTFAGNPASTGGANAIVMTDTNHCIISNISTDHFSAADAGNVVVIVGSSNNNIVVGDTFDTGSNGTALGKVGLVAPTGLQNVITGASTDGSGFTANDTTPSVGNALTGLFTTANTAPTSITTLDDGRSLQEVEILVNDANTTFVHSAALYLQGGVDYSPVAGAIIKFRKYPTLWREIGRNPG